MGPVSSQGRTAHFDTGAAEGKPNYIAIGRMEMGIYGHTFPNPDDPHGSDPGRQQYLQQYLKDSTR